MRRSTVVLALVALLAIACSSSNGSSSSGQASTPSAPHEDTPPAHADDPTPTSPTPTAPERAAFDRILWTGHERPCPPPARGDCDISAELLADGTLHLDPWGAPGVAPLEAHATDTELADAAPALTSGALLGLLDAPRVCPDANDTESLLVRIAGTDHDADTGYCNDPPLLDARTAVQSLVRAHFPDHHLISPPF
jgi:hypothetical protein